MRKIACAVLSLTVLAGCSDPKAASEKNFKVAAQAYLDTIYPKCYVIQNFPITKDYYQGDTRNSLIALAKAGLVQEKELSRKDVRDWGGEKRIQVKSSFELSETGRKFYKQDVASAYGGKYSGFCVGKAEVMEVVRYTEPADTFGQRLSQVNFTYTVKDLPDWAKSSELIEAVPALKPDVGSDVEPLKRTDTFVLTNNGWMHGDLFKK